MKTYKATALMFGNERILDSATASLIGKVFYTKFAGSKVLVKFYQEGEHLMAEWRTKTPITPDTVYLDTELSCEADNLTGNIINITDVLGLSVSPTHANKEAIKITLAHK